MRFTPSATWSLLEGAGSKGLVWRIYARQINTLSGSLTSGSWLDVSDYVSSFPGVDTRIEYEVGEFVSNQIDVEGIDLAYWRDSVLTTGSAYTEVKVTLNLTDGAKVTTDTPIVFSGFVARDTVQYNELTDRVNFSVYTVQDVASAFPAEVLSAQYVNTNIDTLGTDGLTLPNIPRLYVKDANISGSVLQPGTHTITYAYTASGSTRTVALDDGEEVALSNGDTTVYNGTRTQAVTLYTIDTTKLPTFPDSGYLTDAILVTVPATLPRNWLRYVSAKSLLRKCFAQFGISSVTWGDLRAHTARVAEKVSFVEMVPDDTGSWTDFALALETDGADLWVGVGNKLYKRSMTDDTYTLKATLLEGSQITRIFHASASGDIWVYANSTASGSRVLKHIISNGSNSSEVPLTGSYLPTNCLYDAGRNTFLYVDITHHAVREVPASTMTDTLVFDQATMGYSGSAGPTEGFMFESSGKFYFATSVTGEAIWLHRIYFAAGSWEDDGQVLNVGTSYGNIGCLHPTESRVYFYDAVDAKIRSHPLASATKTDVLTMGYQEIPESIVFVQGRGSVYYTSDVSGTLVEIADNTASVIHAGEPRLFTSRFGFAGIGSDLYGLSQMGRLYKYGDTVELCAGVADFSGQSVRDAFNQVLGAFHLVATIDGKSAKVYQRTALSGSLNSTGNTASVTIAEASDITSKTLPAVQVVNVSNSSGSTSYDGTTWNSSALSTSRSVDLTSELIEPLILDEVALKLWDFFGRPHVTYTIPLEALPAVEYEPLDAVSLALGSTKVGVSSVVGVLVATGVDANGTTTFEVLT